MIDYVLVEVDPLQPIPTQAEKVQAYAALGYAIVGGPVALPSGRVFQAMAKARSTMIKEALSKVAAGNPSIESKEEFGAGKVTQDAG